MEEREYDLMHAVEEHHWWYVALHETLLPLVAAERTRRARPLRMLDAGCGTGQLCRLLAPFGTVSGCDRSPRALALARARGVTAFAADLASAELGEDQYDLITAIDVLYHRAVSDEAAVLKKFYRALRPGGVLIVHLPAFELLRGDHDLAVHTRRRHTSGTLKPLLAAAGFSLERLGYRLGWLFLPLLALRAGQRLRRHRSPAVAIRSDVATVAPRRNRLLLALCRAERYLSGDRPLPWGTSLLAVARKPQPPGAA